MAERIRGIPRLKTNKQTKNNNKKQTWKAVWTNCTRTLGNLLLAKSSIA